MIVCESDINPAARRKKRLRLAIAAAIALALILALAVVLRSAERAASRSAVRAAIERETGLRVSSIDGVALVLWPEPGVVARRVVFAPSGPLLRGQFDALAIHLDWTSLLFGRVRASGVMLEKGEASIDSTTTLPPEWRAASSRETRTLGRARAHDLKLSWSGADGTLHEARVVQAQLAWRDAASPLALDGEFLFPGDDAPVSLVAYAHRPVDLWNGRTSLALLKIAGPSGDALFQGELSEGVGFRGRASIHAHNLADLRRRGWIDSPTPAGVSKAALEADVAWTHRGVSFTDATLALDGAEFEGSLNMRREDGRPSLSGTLAADELDLSPWFAAAPTLLQAQTGASIRWRTTPIDWSAEARGDVDLRVSARKAKIGPLETQTVALALLMKKGRLDLTLSEASGYKGSARGRLTVTPTANGLDVKGAARWADIDVATLPPDLVRPRWRGLSSGQIDFDALGSTPRELAAALDGRGSFTMKSGEVRGFDLEAATRRAGRRLPSLPHAPTLRTSFDELTGAFKVLHGSGQIETLSLLGPGVAMAGRGVFDLGGLSLSARLETSPGKSATGFPPPPIVFVLRGPLFAPTLSVEPGPMDERAP